MKRLWVFDLDGTLIDSLLAITDNINLALKKFSYKEIGTEEAKSCLGNGAGYLVEKVCQIRAIREEERKEFYRAYMEIYKENPIGRTLVFDGFDRVLKKIKDRGDYLAVLTNKPHLIAEEVMEKLLNDYKFDFVLGDKEGFERKPSGKSLIDLMKRYCVEEKDTYMLGDTEVDYLTGKNAGCKTVLVTWGFREKEELEKLKPDYLIEKMEDLEKII